MNKLIEAKIRLSILLLEQPIEEKTDAEINIGYELSKDDDIQAILKKAVEEDKKKEENK